MPPPLSCTPQDKRRPDDGYTGAPGKEEARSFLESHESSAPQGVPFFFFRSKTSEKSGAVFFSVLLLDYFCVFFLRLVSFVTCTPSIYIYIIRSVYAGISIPPIQLYFVHDHDLHIHDARVDITAPHPSHIHCISHGPSHLPNPSLAGVF